MAVLFLYVSITALFWPACKCTQCPTPEKRALLAPKRSAILIISAYQTYVKCSLISLIIFPQQMCPRAQSRSFRDCLRTFEFKTALLAHLVAVRISAQSFETERETEISL